MGHMPDTIKVEVDDSIARRFRRRAMERYGYRKGSMKKALEDAMRRYSVRSEGDWASLVGTLKTKRDGVWLQHHAWSDEEQ